MLNSQEVFSIFVPDKDDMKGRMYVYLPSFGIHYMKSYNIKKSQIQKMFM